MGGREGKGMGGKGREGGRGRKERKGRKKGREGKEGKGEGCVMAFGGMDATVLWPGMGQTERQTQCLTQFTRGRAV